MFNNYLILLSLQDKLIQQLVNHYRETNPSLSDDKVQRLCAEKFTQLFLTNSLPNTIHVHIDQTYQFIVFGEMSKSDMAITRFDVKNGHFA